MQSVYVIQLLEKIKAKTGLTEKVTTTTKRAA